MTVPHMAKFDAGNCSVGARSETGYVRDENQDRMGWIRAPFGDVYIVSDGMGGVGDGALAAELTVGALQRHLGAVRFARRKAVRRAFAAANGAVHARAQTEGAGTPGMGATAVAVLLRGARIMVAHVGDSRAYLFDRTGQCQRLTRDHSLVQRLVDRGVLSPAQAQTHPDAGVIERAVGHARDIEVDIGPWLPLRNGDRILVCSDGLCGYTQDAEIAAVLRANADPQEAADRLVELALAKGGEDNITVQVIRYEGVPGHGAMRPVDYLAVVLTTAAASTAAILVSQVYLAPAMLREGDAALRRQAEVLRRPMAEMNALHARLDGIEQDLERRCGGAEPDATPQPTQKPTPKPAMHKQARPYQAQRITR